MVKIIVCTDDMNPSVVPIWKQTWDELKEKRRDLKVTSFTVPLWMGNSEYDVFRNKEFKEWYRERKGWVEIAQKGYTNHTSPECIRFEKPQYFMLKRGYRKIGSYMPSDYYSFKPTHNRMNRHTSKILQSLGFSCVVFNQQMILLKKAENPIPEHIIIETHINIIEKHPDDIQHAHRKLNKKLIELEEKKYEYSTIRDLLVESIGKECNDEFNKEEIEA